MSGNPTTLPDMVQIKTNANIKDISGSIGENIFSSNRGRLYIRSKGKTHSNPQSSNQANHRNRISEVSKYWNDTLTQAQHNAWEQYAKTIKSKESIMSGFNAFLKLNINYSGFDIVSAPTYSTFGDAPINRTAFTDPGYSIANMNIPAPTSGNIISFETFAFVAGNLKMKLCRETNGHTHVIAETPLIAVPINYSVKILAAPIPCLAGDILGFYCPAPTRLRRTFDVALRWYMSFGDVAPGGAIAKVNYGIPALDHTEHSIRATIEGPLTPEIIDDPPIGITGPDAPVDLTATWNAGTKKIDVTWAAGNVPGSRIGIWLHSIDSPVHRQLVANEDITVLTKSISQVKAAKGVTLNLSQLKGVFDIQAQACDIYGQLSAPTKLISEIKVT